MAGAGEKNHSMVLRICVTGLFMGLNVLMSSFSVPVPGGHLYLNDVIIDTAALLLDPFSAFLVGGVGAFLGDLFFYPPSMFVSLIAHGLEAALIAFLYGRKKHGFGASLAITILGGVVMVAGYTLGRAYVYSTPAYAIVKLPFEILQAGFGAVMAMVLCYPMRLKSLYDKIVANG